MPTGVNLDRYAGLGSHISWHSDNEPLFGPQNSSNLTVSVSFGHSVEFQVRRRARCCALFDSAGPWCPLGHGWSSPVGVCASHGVWAAGSSGHPYVPLDHTAHYVLSTCRRGWLGTGDSNWASFWVMILLLSIWVCSLPVACMDQATERSGVATVVRAHPTGGALPSMGSCLLGWEKALATVAALGRRWKLCSFLQNMVPRFLILPSILVTSGSP